MRTLNCIIVIPDDDHMEHKARLQLENTFGYLGGEASYLKDITILSNTDDLYKEDEVFRNLCKLEKKAKNAKKDYINRCRLKKSK